MSQRRLVVIVVVVMVAAVAPFTRFFQIVAAGLRLAAMLTMLTFGIVQLALRIANPFFALSFVIAIKRSRGDHSAQE
jgi:hypothetical protein